MQLVSDIAGAIGFLIFLGAVAALTALPFA